MRGAPQDRFSLAWCAIGVAAVYLGGFLVILLDGLVWGDVCWTHLPPKARDAVEAVYWPLIRAVQWMLGF